MIIEVHVSNYCTVLIFVIKHRETRRRRLLTLGICIGIVNGDYIFVRFRHNENL